MSDPISSLLDRIGGAKRVMILVVGIAAAGLIFAVAQWAGTPTWVPAFAGVPLENVTQITDKLDQAGVKYKLERGGADIMVAEADLAKARVALAKGGMPTAGRPGLELFDQPSWGMTDFTQRINYRRALEGELERVIGKMRGIESANVHLVMHETDGFAAQDRPTEASVVLKLEGRSRSRSREGHRAPRRVERRRAHERARHDRQRRRPHAVRGRRERRSPACRAASSRCSARSKTTSAARPRRSSARWSARATCACRCRRR